MSVKIIVDSTADINPAILDRFTVVPLTIRFGDEEYVDGVTITNQRFYEKLIESDVLPTTSQATPAAFEDVFRKIADDGDSAVVITLASELSGTYQSAVVAAMEYTDRIFVVDSRTVAIGSGVLAEYALRLADSGMEAETIYKLLLKERDNVCVVALLDTLEYLKKGGRISKTVAFTGTMLSIKPVVNVKDGKINVLGKARGSKQGNNLLAKQIQDFGGFDPEMPVLLGYTGLSDAMLLKYMEDSRYLWEGKLDHLNTTCLGSVIGTHAGPGAVGAAFFKNRESD